MPTEAESMVVQQAAMIARTTTVTLIERIDAFFMMSIVSNSLKYKFSCKKRILQKIP
jgi:hypothetical protein